MEGELVNSRPSEKLTENAADEPFPMTAKFLECLPYYMAIGMTPVGYWDCACDDVIIYRKAHEIKVAEQNQFAWLQGLYVYDAISCLVPVLHAFADRNCKPLPYPAEPYPLTAVQVKERKEAEARKKYEDMKQETIRRMERINARFKQKEGGINS